MCRMILIAKPNSSHEQSMTNATDPFLQLCENGCVPEGAPKGHKDGWGIIGLKERGPMQKYHDLGLPTSQENKSIFDSFVKNNQAVVAHLRKASMGSVRLENCHPFAGYDFAFAHNGSIESVDDIILELTDDRLLHAGDTDSERLFALCMHIAKKACGNVFSNPDALSAAFANAVMAVAAKIVEYFGKFPEKNKAFNILASNGHKHLAMRLFNANHPKAEALGFDAYYTLYANVKAEGLVICSEPVGLVSGWELIPNGELWEFEDGIMGIKKTGLL